MPQDLTERRAQVTNAIDSVICYIYTNQPEMIQQDQKFLSMIINMSDLVGLTMPPVLTVTIKEGKIDECEEYINSKYLSARFEKYKQSSKIDIEETKKLRLELTNSRIKEYQLLRSIPQDQKPIEVYLDDYINSYRTNDSKYAELTKLLNIEHAVLIEQTLIDRGYSSSV